MWTIARTVVMWVFGDDIVKYTLYVIGGFFLIVYVEATAATAAIESQAFGQWWLAGVGGGAQPATTTQRPPTQTGQTGQTGPGATAVPVPTLAPMPVVSLDRVTTLIASAMTWLGVRYRWGGCSRAGVDCSCYMENIFATVGVHLPRTTVEQIRVATPVAPDQAAAGDLVFYDNTCDDCGPNPTHVGLYLGDGRMVDAGDPVQIERVFTGHNARYGRVLT